jgi:hypothetical protein
MYLERLLALMTGAVVAACLGLGLVLMAMGPGKKSVEPPDAQRRSAANEADSSTNETAGVEPPAMAAARAKVEAVIAAAPDYAPFFTRLREAFPAEYEAALDDFAVRHAVDKQEPNADYYLSEAVRRLRQARGALASKAESGPLARVFEMQAEVLKAVAKADKRLCVAFLYGATNLDFQRFSNGRRPLLRDMALAGLEAIASGQARKIERGGPTEADFLALEAALSARGLGKAEIDALLDGKMPDPPLEAAPMCAAGQVYFEVLRALPEAPRSRIYGLAVELMARS